MYLGEFGLPDVARQVTGERCRGVEAAMRFLEGGIAALLSGIDGTVTEV